MTLEQLDKLLYLFYLVGMVDAFESKGYSHIIRFLVDECPPILESIYEKCLAEFYAGCQPKDFKEMRSIAKKQYLAFIQEVEKISPANYLPP